MDESDEAIVGLLETDGRLTHREIAQVVGLSRSAVAARMQRLITSGQVVIRGVVHPDVLGRGSLAHIGLTVRGPAEAVAERVAARDDTAFVSVATGRFGVMAEVRAASTLEIDQAVGELRSLDGVQGVDTVFYVEVVRDVVGPVGTVSYQVDETDVRLLRALQADGRASYVDLALLVGMSPASARRRVIRLTEEQVIRVGALVRQTGSDRQASMGLGIRVADDGAHAIAGLATMRSVTFVARTLGRADILASVRAYSPAQLLAVLEHVRLLPGVTDVDNWGHLRVVKETYAVGTL